MLPTAECTKELPNLSSVWEATIACITVCIWLDTDELTTTTI